MRPRAYFDHNATTPLRPQARAAMLAVLDRPGNASAVHAEGRQARLAVETARRELAGALNAAEAAVVFTSGGTEAANLALTPTLALDGCPFDALLIGAGEHPCVLNGWRFPPEAVASVALTPGGALDLDDLGEVLHRLRGRRVMLALQAANNETGVVQPVAAAARMVHDAGGALVCDGAQAAGRIECDLARLGADAFVVSAHKFGGPQGVGALCFRKETPHIKETMMRGGGQERGLRAGTEPVAAVVGLVAALNAARQGLGEEASRLGARRGALEAEIAALRPEVVFFGRGEERLPNTSCFAIPGLEAQLLLIALDVEGVAVSAGSACSSGKVKRSHVLAAMGVAPDLARGAIRVSLGWSSTDAECVLLLEALKKALRSVKARRSA